MTHGSLFSGIGGFDLAAERTGCTNVFQVENDPWCQQILKKNFPSVARYGDITQFNAKAYANKIDLLTGGFPCQPFSIAGKQKGKADNRYLWPEMLRVIREIKPKFIIGENVFGIIKLALDQVLSDLEDIGYTTETFIIPACAQNAPHRRDRVWIIAYQKRIQNKLIRYYNTLEKGSRSKDTKALVFSNTARKRWQKRQYAQVHDTSLRDYRRATTCRNYWKSEPTVGRVLDGVSYRLDRIKGLGNAIVPQIAEEIIKGITLVYCTIK
jgi:DNA (cytosine-5)-methyltransferase 1